MSVTDIPLPGFEEPPPAAEEVITPPGQAEPVLIVRHDASEAFLSSSWEVWLEPHVRAHADGLCVGTGVSRALALADASRTLNALALEALLAIQLR